MVSVPEEVLLPFLQELLWDYGLVVSEYTGSIKPGCSYFVVILSEGKKD